jgi:hypothetical protein
VADAARALPEQRAAPGTKTPARTGSSPLRGLLLQIRYDKVERRIEISAIVSEAVAKAFEKTKDLPEEVSRVTLRDIAGARFVPPSDERIVEQMRLAALNRR